VSLNVDVVRYYVQSISGERFAVDEITARGRRSGEEGNVSIRGGKWWRRTSYRPSQVGTWVMQGRRL